MCPFSILNFVLNRRFTYLQLAGARQHQRAPSLLSSIPIRQRFDHTLLDWIIIMTDIDYFHLKTLTYKQYAKFFIPTMFRNVLIYE